MENGHEARFEALSREVEGGGLKLAVALDEAERILGEGASAGAAPADATALPAPNEEDVRTLLARATLPQKIKYAMFGNAACRLILIYDPNRMIQGFVLRNPKLSLKEVEDFARNPNCPEGVLRGISDRKEWMKHYPLKTALVGNPKTPLDVGMKWLRHLTPPDLKTISRSKNLPQVIAVTAKKRLLDVERKK